MRDLIIRPCEPEDYKAVHLVYSSLQAMAETLGVPYSSEQAWREELSRQRDDNFAVVACVQGEVVGHLALSVYMNPRTRHSGHFGIAVRDHDFCELRLNGVLGSSANFQVLLHWVRKLR